MSKSAAAAEWSTCPTDDPITQKQNKNSLEKVIFLHYCLQWILILLIRVSQETLEKDSLWSQWASWGNGQHCEGRRPDTIDFSYLQMRAVIRAQPYMSLCTCPPDPWLHTSHSGHHDEEHFSAPSSLHVTYFILDLYGNYGNPHVTY